uniref:C-type lectin domain-containing protein n=1 Tax=Neogobius melanostomus TaxID=47308 RepID=A0A8C6UZY5_9GOBI
KHVYIGLTWKLVVWSLGSCVIFLVETKHCPDLWVRFHNSCYLLSPNPKNWADSRQDCEEQGAHLVIITSPEEQVSLISLTVLCLWIGLTDRDSENEWRWVNGDNVTSPTQKQPDNWRGDEDCGEICNDKWNDKKCSDTQRFICERQKVCTYRN